MTRTITLSYEDAAALAGLLAMIMRQVGLYVGQDDLAALGRLADALDEAEAREPNGLFPEPYVISEKGVRYRVRSRAEDADD